MRFSFCRKNACRAVSLLFLIAPLPTCPLSSDELPNDNSINPPVVFVTPTKADKELAQRFSALVEELDQPFGLARELINGIRNGELTYFPATLESSNPVHPRMLRHARRFVQGMLPQLEAAQKMTSPSPHFVTASQGKIKLDGRLDELSWKRAAQTSIRFQRSGKARGQVATAKLLWDEKFLYIGFSVPDSNIIAPEMPRDGEVWRYDCVEIFLMPDKNSGVYWEIEISPTGSILDYLCTKHPDQWGSEFRTGETIQGLKIGRTIRGKANQAEGKDDGYIIEVAVPFDQLPGVVKKPKQGDQIYALLGWVNNNSGAAHNATISLAQVPFLTWFHNVWAYQPLVLADDRGRTGKNANPVK